MFIYADVLPTCIAIKPICIFMIINKDIIHQTCFIFQNVYSPKMCKIQRLSPTSVFLSSACSVPDMVAQKAASCVEHRAEEWENLNPKIKLKKMKK